MPQWEVVGGGDSGGILVREGQDLASPKAAKRLSTGAIVDELALIDERLHYRLAEGRGPAEGWVSIRLPGNGKELLRRKREWQPGAVNIKDLRTQLEGAPSHVPSHQQPAPAVKIQPAPASKPEWQPGAVNIKELRKQLEGAPSHVPSHRPGDQQLKPAAPSKPSSRALKPGIEVATFALG